MYWTDYPLGRTIAWIIATPIIAYASLPALGMFLHHIVGHEPSATFCLKLWIAVLHYVGSYGWQM